MTEKNYNQQQQTMKTMQKQQVASQQKVEIAPVKKEETKTEEIKEESKEEKRAEEKKKEIKKIIKKDEAVVNGISLPISTKTSSAICRFIKGKSPEKAVRDLEQVLKFKKVIPMKGEIPHKKGKGIMAGRYPIKAIGYFIRMLKNLQANAIINGLEEPIIIEAVPNKASQPYGRFGSIRRKRTHVKIRVVERKLKEKKSGAKE